MLFKSIRNITSKPGVYLLMSLAVAGCATQPGGFFKRGQTQQTANANPTTPTNEQVATPSAPTDLWERIAAGRQLHGFEDELAVRGMVQFYAGQQRHITDSAERARPYLRHIVDNLEARNMPMELALLPLVESSFDPFAGGGKRASGLWQFMPITAERFGLNNNQWYEGRRDVLLSTRAALDYLSWLHGRFDDWLLAIAAYNAGEGRVGRAIEAAAAQGKPQDYWHLDLPTETERYIPKLLAFSELLEHSQRFDITWPRTPDEATFVAVELPARTSLATAADMMGVSMMRLRNLNPALRGNITQPGGPHVLLVPVDRAEQFQTALANVADTGRLRWVRHSVTENETLTSISKDFEVSLSDLRRTNDLTSGSLSAGQRIWIPKLPTLPTLPTAVAEKPAQREYRVASGDSLWAIANRNSVTIAQLRQWNGLSNRAAIQPGQTLKILGGKNSTDTSAPAATYYQVRSGDSLWSIAQRFNISMDRLLRLNNLNAKSVLQPSQRLLVNRTGPQTVYYQVREGDSLWSIATRYEVPVTQLKNWNSLGGNGLIKPGQRLKILIDTTG